MRTKGGVDPRLGDFASHRDSATRVFLDVYGDLRIVKNVVPAKLSCDRSFSFAATEASQSNMTNQRHRAVSAAVHPPVLGKLRRAVHRDLDFITRPDDERRSSVLLSWKPRETSTGNS